MRKVEQTRKNLNTKNMNQDIKQEMLDRFKKAGGTVVRDGSSNKTGVIKRTHRPKNDTSIIHNESDFSIPITSDTNSKRDQLVKSDNKDISSFFNSLVVKFKAKFGGVCNFNGDVSLKFVKQVNTELNKYLFNLKLLEKELNPKNVASLKKEFQLYEFLTSQIFNLYNSEDFEHIQRNVYLSYGSHTSSKDFKTPFYRIFKRLYLLYSYQKIIYKILDVITKDIKQKELIIYKDIKNEFNLIYSYFFEKLYLFVICQEQKNIPIFCSLMEKILSITEEDKAIKLENNEEDLLKEKEEDEEEKDEIHEVSDNIYLSKGLELINSINIENKKLKFLAEKDISNYDSKDKNHLIYVTFKEFEIEYSPILITNQIKLSEKLKVSQKNISYPDFRQDVYDSMIYLSKKIEVYNQAKSDYIDYKKERPLNYIIAAKKEKELNSKIENSGFALKIAVKDVLKQTIDLFSPVIKEFESQNEKKNNKVDYNENKILLNPTDNLMIDLNQSPIFKNKTVKEAIIQIYSYCVAFLYNLKHDKF